MAGGTEVARAFVTIVPVVNGAKSAITSAVVPGATAAGATAGGMMGKGLLSGFGGLAATAGKAFLGLTAAAGVATGAFIKSAVSAGKEFDAAMSQVAATMGITNDELESQVVTVGDFTGNLRDFAKEMGRTTAFSATESAEALNYMALAGYDAATSVKMLPTVLNLAASGSMDLARASDMVTDAQSALGLTLDDTSVMVDQMAKTASKSNTSVEQLGDAFLTVGGTAKMMKGGTQELSTVLGILADNGIKGSEGGTALRNILLSLSAPTDKARKVLDDLGVSVFDAEGNMRSMQDIITDLNAAMDGMTDEERTQAISTIFNKRDLKSVNALLGTSVDRWEELGAAIGDAEGAAAKMAEVQLDNLEGDIGMFKSALEGFQIAIAEKLDPYFREFVQFGTDALSRLTEAFGESGLQGAAETFGEVMQEGAKLITSTFVPAIAALAPEIIKLVPTIVGALAELVVQCALSIADNAPAILDSVLDMVDGVLEMLSSNTPAILDAVFGLLGSIANAIVTRGPDILLTFAELVLGLVEGIWARVPDMLDAASEFFLHMGEGADKSQPTILDRLGELVSRLVADVVDNAPRFLTAAMELIGSMSIGFLKSLPKILSTLGKILLEVVKSIPSLINGFIQSGKDLIGNIVEGINSDGRSIPERIGEFLGNALREKALKTAQFLKAGKELVTNIVKGIAEKAPEIPGKIAEAIKDFISNMPKYVAEAMKAGKDFVGGFISGITGKKSEVSTAGGDVADAAVTAAGGRNTKFKEAGSTSAKYMADGITSGKSNMTTAVNGIAQAGVDASGKANKNYNSAGAKWSYEIKQGVASGAGKIAQGAGALANTAIEQWKNKDTYTPGYNFTAGFKNGMSDARALASAKAAASNVGRAAVEALKVAIKQGSPSKITRESGGFFAQGFALGIEDDAKMAVKAAENMASATVGALEGGASASIGLDGSGRELVAVNITGNEFNVSNEMDARQAAEIIGTEVQRQLAGRL